MYRPPTSSNDGDPKINPQIQNKSTEANYITGHRINCSRCLPE